MHVLRLLLACTLLTGPLLASDPPPAPKPPPSPDLVLKGVQSFLALTARPDGSFRPGIDPEYEGMADSAFSDLAPAAYAVVLSKTFGLKLLEAAIPVNGIQRQQAIIYVVSHNFCKRMSQPVG